MTVVVITAELTEKDIIAAFPGEGNRWVIVPSVEVAAAEAAADLYIDLDFVNEPGRTALLARLLPAPVLINSVVSTLSEIGFPFIRINGWPGFLERSLHELAVADEKMAACLPGLYEKLGVGYRIVPDTPGMISARILSTIINEAYFTWEEKVSTIEAIDIAMKLGTNYPLGPFEWGQRIGLDKVTRLLAVLSEQNTRYNPCSSLLTAAEVLKYD